MYMYIVQCTIAVSTPPPPKKEDTDFLIKSFALAPDIEMFSNTNKRNANSGWKVPPYTLRTLRNFH